MPRGKELDPQTRSRICELKSIGWGAKRIHQKHPEIPLNTIKTTIRRENQRLNNVSQPRSGRPRQLTEEQRDHLYDLTTTNPHIKMHDLLEEVDHAVKERSIRNLLHEMGRRKWRQLQRPEITEFHAQKRLAWAQEYEHFMPQDWARVRWSDECTVERGAGIQPIWTFLLECHSGRVGCGYWYACLRPLGGWVSQPATRPRPYYPTGRVGFPDHSPIFMDYSPKYLVT